MLLGSVMGSPPVARAEQFTCIAVENQGQGKPTCIFPKEIISRCSNLPSSSIFAQCNIYALSIGAANLRSDDNNQQYQSAIFKYSERNSCSTGDNDAISLLGKCDTFAAYAQVLRNTSTNQCFALVNSALLGVQLREDGLRNNPNKWIQKLEIPGVSRRITFTPVSSAPLLEQPSSVLIRTADSGRRYLVAGPSVSALHLLALESALTVKPENLRPNPAKIRITRGTGSASDFLDIPLGRREEAALNSILAGCS
ncbi:MAG: hypothetical protein ACKO6F_08895 [Cyanobium sp.]